MTVVMLVVSVTMFKIFTAELDMIMTLTYGIGLVRCKYINRKPIHDILFDGNCNDFHIGRHFQAIFCQNVHDFDYDLQRGPTSTVNMSIEKPYMNCYLMVIVMFTLYITIPKIIIIKMCMTLTLTLKNCSMLNVNMPIASPYVISCVMIIVISSLSFTISKIFAFGICMTLTLIIRMSLQGKMQISITVSKIFTVQVSYNLDLDILNGSRSNVNLSIESPYMTSYLTAIVILPYLSWFVI